MYLAIDSKQFEIFSGTGGVGKTTMATSRAIEIAETGKRVLLITIDPAKRLKELLGLSDKDSGNNVTIQNPLGVGEDISLDALLMNPEETIKRIAEQTNTEAVAQSRIMKILAKPYGGLNEILSIVELQMNLDKNIYDTIVLDTPPGSHFLDFLESVDKIRAFFDQKFVDIFNYVGKKSTTSTSGAGKKLMTMVVSGGVKKLLSYLQKVTGGKFVEDFMEAVGAIYQSKDSFISALNLQKELKDHSKSNWYLVTSVDQNKMKEALDLRDHAKDLFDNKTYVILNKCLNDKIKEWEPSEGDLLALKLKDSFSHRETSLKMHMKDKFQNVLEFSEVLKVSPLDHVKELIIQWKNIDTNSEIDTQET
jgi:anion-transporting  ArsA/GET3 family ATPase